MARRFRLLWQSRLLWVGVGLVVIGAVPFLLAIGWSHLVGEEDSNPVACGIFFAIMVWPGALLAAAGLIDGMMRVLAGHDPDAGDRGAGGT